MNSLERIETLAKEIKDKPLLKIVKCLLSRTDMNEKYLNEEKTLKQMIEFIKSEAQKQAIHYFDESNKKLNLESTKNNVKEKEVNTENKETSQKAIKSKKVEPEGQLTLFDI